MSILFKITIPIIIGVFLYYFNTKQKKENIIRARKTLAIESRKKYKEQLKKEALKPVKIVSKIEKKEQLDNLYKIIELLVKTNDTNKLKSLISKKIDSENKFENWNIKEEFINNEVMLFLIKENISFYCYLDWKQESFYLKDWIEKTLLINFNTKLDLTDTCDLEQNKFIHDVVPIYEKVLYEKNLIIRNIDIGSDSYQIIIAEKNKLNDLERLVNLIGFKLKKVQS